MTEIDRRSFLAALGAAVGLGADGARASSAPVFVSSASKMSGADSVAAFSADGRLLFATRLPSRGHDITARPGSTDLVVFARRPGNWAAIVDRHTGQVGKTILSPDGRHFYGHGVFSPDGRLLYATENAIEAGTGVLGVYDAEAGYKRIGEIPSHGIGPHDLAFLPGGREMIVANGGIRTNPGSGREILNDGDMEPSLSRVDPATGEARFTVDLGPELKALSIRHLAMAEDGETVFACQYKGDVTALPSLVGVLRPDGQTRILEMPEPALASLENYVGSVSLDRSGEVIAATSPRGGIVAFWKRKSGRFLGRRLMSDVCGVAAGSTEGVFVVSSGNAGVRLAAASRTELERVGGSDLDRWVWDNHILPL